MHTNDAKKRGTATRQFEMMNAVLEDVHTAKIVRFGL